MIVRTHKEVPRSYLYGAAGGVAMAVAAILGLKAWIVPTVTAACSERYATGVRFSYARQNGTALTPADLQGRLAGHDWGLNENVRMVKLNEPAEPVVLEIALHKPLLVGDEVSASRSGMGFVWQPKALRNAGAACLGYNVWVPQGFDYGTGGVLPGLFGDFGVAEKTEATQKIPPFSTRMRWRPEGTLQVVPVTQDWLHGDEILLEPSRLRLEQGSWMRIEQEIVLNEPGKADGVLRVWVDGDLKLERGEINYRADDFQRIIGVAADVHYTRKDFDWAPALTDNKLRLSGFDLRVQ